MKHESAEQLLEKYYLGKICTEELVELEAWFETLPEQRMELGKREKENFSRRMKLEIDKATGHVASGNQKLWPFIATAAAAIATIVFGVWLYTSRNPFFNHTSQFANQQNIGPGKKGATLTFSNGKTIALSDAQKEISIGERKISYADGSSLTSDQVTSHNSEVTASTAKGQTYAFILPDGTKVWLNADSKIRFLQQFVKDTREVSLDGEAYFEVAKNKKVPFIVKSIGQEVQVLGTHFNVKRYTDGSSGVTTLLEGSVLVKLPDVEREIKPGEQAVNNGHTLVIGQADTKDATAWKNGYFRFKETRLSEIARELDRWYNVDIMLEDNLANKQFTGKISRSKNMNHILNIIQRTININYKIEGRRITITDK